MGIYETLYDKRIISDLRIRREDDVGYFFKVKRSKHLIFIPKKVTTEIAYLSGAIAGDGCFHKTESKDRKYPRVRIAITGGDIGYLKVLDKFFHNSFGAGGIIYKDKRKKSCYSLHINHRVIWLYFKRVLRLDKETLSVPPKMANKELFRHFLAGFFDTDGYRSNGVFGTMMSSKNLKFLEELRQYSHDLHGFEFSKVRTNILRCGDRAFGRAYMTLKKKEGARFSSIVPLMNRKYGPTQDRTGDLRCFLSVGKLQHTDVRATS